MRNKLSNLFTTEDQSTHINYNLFHKQFKGL